MQQCLKPTPYSEVSKHSSGLAATEYSWDGQSTVLNNRFFRLCQQGKYLKYIEPQQLMHKNWSSKSSWIQLSSLCVVKNAIKNPSFHKSPRPLLRKNSLS